MNNLILITLCFGLNLCLTEKEYLLDKLKKFDEKLTVEIENYKNHGFNHYANRLENIYKPINDIRNQIKLLPENANINQTKKESNLVLIIEGILFTSIKHPDQHESIKSNALYFAAMQKNTNQFTKDHYNISSDELIQNILKIIEYEKIIQKNLSSSNEQDRIIAKSEEYTLNKMYKSIEDFLKKYKIPSAEEHYRLANVTRDVIKDMIQHNQIVNATLLQEIIKNFDQFTLELAQKLPINETSIVLNYFKLANMQYKIRIYLENFLIHSNTIKNDLLKRLDNVEINIQKAIDVLFERNLIYFAKTLNSTLERIHFIRKNVQRLPTDIDKKGAYLMISEVKYLETIVPYYIANPNPGESLKARGLYLAAMKSNNDHIANSNVTSLMLYKQVKTIVNQEFSMKSITGSSSFDKIYYQTAQKYLGEMYGILKTLIFNSIIPTSDDDVKIEKDAKKKIKELIAHNMSVEAEIWNKELDYFVNKTTILNMLFPIQTIAIVDEWFTCAKLHFVSAEKLQILLDIKLPIDSQTIDCSNKKCKKHDRTTDL